MKVFKYYFFFSFLSPVNATSTSPSALHFCSLLVSSFVSQTRFLFIGFVNDNIPTFLSFCDHKSRHRVAPHYLLLIQGLWFSLWFLIGPSPFTFSNHPYLSLAPSSQSPPQNSPLSPPKGLSSPSLKRNHLFPISLVSNPDNLGWVRFHI